MNSEARHSRHEKSFEDDQSTQFATTSLGNKTTEDDDAHELPNIASDRYQLCEQIARGGMGFIYHARDLTLEREVAVKVLRARFREDQYVRGKFVNEARVMSFLPHPGLPPIYDCGVSDDGRPYHVMKLIKGVTLSTLLKEGQVNEPECFKIFSDICETIAYAHSHEVIHLDLKPDNVMVGAFGEVHVMDWGLARCHFLPRAKSSEGTELGVKEDRWGIDGTPEYMAPEQARGEALDASTDVFGLGAILCRILIGRGPYQGDTVGQVFDKAAKANLEDTMQRLEESTSDHALIRLARRCLQPRKSDRPKNAVVVAREVERYQQSALERARSDMSRFFELTLDLFCIAGLDGYFRRINSNFSRLLGHAERDLLARPFLEFVHPKDRNRTIAQMALLREGRPVVRFRNRYRTAAGKYIILEWTAKSVEEEGIIFAVARDVTDSVPAERASDTDPR